MARWTPLQPATVLRNPERLDAIVREALRSRPGQTEAELRRVLAEELALPVYKNLDYQVAVRREKVGEEEGRDVHEVHLSIKRVDQRPIRDWRHLQQIKNELVGPECEMVEIFPAESRLMDTANQYHLWGYDSPSWRVPFGYTGDRAVLFDTDPETGARQRGALVVD